MKETEVNQKSKMEKDCEEKHLIFSLGEECYGINLLKVIEITGMIPVTMVPKMPDYYRGVINLREKVIPVVDVRIKFGIGRSEYDDRACIIIVCVNARNIPILVGLMVDSVSEVLNISKNDIEPPPELGQKLTARFIQGVSKTGGSIKILLDVDELLDSDEAGLLDQNLPAS